MFDSDINSNKDRSLLSKNVCSKIENSQWIPIPAINRVSSAPQGLKPKVEYAQDHGPKTHKLRNKNSS